MTTHERGPFSPVEGVHADVDTRNRVRRRWVTLIAQWALLVVGAMAP